MNDDMNQNTINQATKPKALAEKVRSSLVLQINLRAISMLVVGFLLFNIIVILAYMSLSVWRIDRQVNKLLSTYSDEELIEDSRPAEIIGFTERKPGRNQGEIIVLDNWFYETRTPVSYDYEQQIYIPAETAGVNHIERIGSIAYEIVLSPSNQSMILSLQLGNYLAIPFWMLISLVIMEIIYVLSKIGSSTRAVRRILSPLDELTAATKTLQQVTAADDVLSEEELEALAVELRGIDAGSLDKRLVVSSEQNELQGLAESINGMLERIRLSYQSQIRFVSDASHELRTPIAVIQGYINLLDRWGKEDSEVRDEAIAAIKSETESMKILIEQLLFLARGENKTLKLNPEYLDACDLADEITKEARLIDSTHPYELVCTNTALIYADKQLIKQAIRILIENAEKYSPDGEAIRIKVRCVEDKVSIEVQDNGIGIAAEDIGRIFDRFYRSDESRARSTGGSGLGLAIAQWIAQQHKGHYEVISRLDIGTRISLVLPAANLNG